MRRTPLRPSTKPIARTALPRARKRIKARGNPRFKGRRDDAFREWLRQQPCALTRMSPEWTTHVLRETSCDKYVRCRGRTECCHVKARSTGGADVGNCLPFCRWHHEYQHLMGMKFFSKFCGFDLAALAAEYGGRWHQEQGA